MQFYAKIVKKMRVFKFKFNGFEFQNKICVENFELKFIKIFIKKRRNFRDFKFLIFFLLMKNL